MVEMPDEVIKMFDNENCDKAKVLSWISTVTGEGDPHLVPVCFVKPVGKDKLLVGASFIKKTIANINEGSRVALGNAAYPNGYMVKGSASVLDKGSYFDDFKQRINERFKGKIRPLAAILISVEEVYHLTPSDSKMRIA